ncbi:peptide ABC transporter permease [Arthrobacter sp. ERGS1:01]|uniref:ABC transporter permease n=1 Tax=Arthrobacter sp. ERGS1:01 TaxID=1704044 RepID=UPI0006B6596D|nr:ABC transporter permease [Arthrobacter sp. ERGS1:01]ALE07378.1 peptide ABC transporter permease [Arthrobacter sp. ERGS1:01]
MFARFMSLRKVQIGLVIMAVFLLAAAFGQPFSEHVLGWTPYMFDENAMGQAPSAQHWMGTTSSGQDALSWLLYGARSSMLVGLMSAVIGTALSVVIGTIAGFSGGAVDRFLNGVILVVQNIPSFAILFMIAGLLQNANVLLVSIIIGGLEWTGGARAIRAQAMSLRGRDFTAALRTIGEHPLRVIMVEVLPHLSGIISPMFLRLIAAGVGMQASLAFLGIGSAAQPSWGLMINYATTQNALFNGQWWWFAPPGLCLALIGFATTMINFGLDEVTNPTLSSKRMTLMRRFLKQKSRQDAAEQAKIGALV